jgi:hypothetical protein
MYAGLIIFGVGGIGIAGIGGLILGSTMGFGFPLALPLIVSGTRISCFNLS